MIKILAKSLREYKRSAILTPVFVILEVIFECLIPYYIAQLVNEIQAGCTLDVIIHYGVILVVMAIISLLGGAMAGYFCAEASVGYATNLRLDIFNKVQEFSFENIDKFSVSSLVTRMTTDVGNVQFAFMMIIRTAIRCPLMIIFSFTMGFIMGGGTAVIFLITIPILGLALFFITRKTMPLFQRVFRKYDTLNESVQENIRGMRVVKSYVREDFEKQKFHNAAEDVQKDFTRAERILALNTPVMSFCIYLVMIFILTFGSYTIINSFGLDMNVGQMAALLTYNFQILMGLMMVSMIFVMVTMSEESSKRIVEVLSEKSTLTSPQNAVTTVRDGSVDFDDVSFEYSAKAERMALMDVNLHIKSGEVIGIIGGTGSSKSTLIQLIPRLYDATKGTVKVGGVDVKNYDLEVLRNQVAVVLQKNELFSGTIKDNLRWGNENATDEEMIKACKLAQADEFIEQMPDKYDTYIEQGGTNVSGGQKQRLCIARALLKNPKIIIFDDSTSAVDTHTDAMIRKALSDYIPETTKIIIAQRIASVEEADRIVVMDGGKIVACGPHEELLKSSAIYREAYNMQNRMGESNE